LIINSELRKSLRTHQNSCGKINKNHLHVLEIGDYQGTRIDSSSLQFSCSFQRFQQTVLLGYSGPLQNQQLDPS